MTKLQQGGYWRRWAKALRTYCRVNQIESMTSAEADALRHQVHVAAFGRDRSHNDFNTRGDVNRIYRRFEYMARTGDFENMVEIVDADEQCDRDRYLRKVFSFPESYYGEIVWDVSHHTTRDPEELQTAQLLNLVRRLETKARNDRQRLIAHETEVPF